MPQNDSMAVLEKKARDSASVLAQIAGILLACWLPPVFAIVIAVRWTDVPKRLRYGGLLLSFLIPFGIVWAEFAKGSPRETLSAFVPCWLYCLTWTVFSICYMKRHGIRASLILKTGAAVIYFFFVLGTILAMVAYFMQR